MGEREGARPGINTRAMAHGSVRRADKVILLFSSRWLSHLFASNHAMSSSPTPNAGTWTHGLFTTLLRDIQLSASLGERITLMAALTSTLSWISADASISGTRDALMLRASTRTFNHVVEHHKRCSTMRSRTETLWLEDSTPLSTLQFRDLVMSGLELRMHRLWESFGNLLESWHHERYCATISHSELTPSGTIDPSVLHTNTPPPFNSTLEEFRNLMNGYVTTCLEMVRNAAPVVAEAPPLKGTPPSSTRGRSKGLNAWSFKAYLPRGPNTPSLRPSGFRGVPPPSV